MSLIDRAVELLKAGRLVAFPTETVYGLGADATNAAAIARVYAAKGRPPTNPLIAHVADIDAARRYVTAWPDMADRLARAFWPGPLTLVLGRADRPGGIAAAATAGGATVALRAPDHPIAQALLRAFAGPSPPPAPTDPPASARPPRATSRRSWEPPLTLFSTEARALSASNPPSSTSRPPRRSSSAPEVSVRNKLKP